MHFLRPWKAGAKHCATGMGKEPVCETKTQPLIVLVITQTMVSVNRKFSISFRLKVEVFHPSIFAGLPLKLKTLSLMYLIGGNGCGDA